MPSPFPGMDPYLEQPGRWQGVHLGLIAGIQEALTSQLRPNFYVRVEERIYIQKGDDPARSLWIPDVSIMPRPGQGRFQSPGESIESEPESEAGGVAVAEPIVTTTWQEEEVHEPYLVIFERERRKAIAVIEVISPSNKVRGAEGRRSFEQKRREIMGSPCHWIEIDLLRTGAPLTIVPTALQPYEYLVHLSRAGQRPQGVLWPIRLSQRLPTLPIPLRPDDDEAKLDLQAVLNTAYDRAGYDLDIDYRQEPDPPLEGEWRAWADRWLREKGLR